MPKLHLYFHTPVPVFKARVNMASVAYPVASIVFDGVTLGAYTDIEFDSTILLGTTEGADDLGRTRVQKPATATAIPVMRSSQGFEDGQVNVQDNAYITVLDDFRVWARLPYFNLDDGFDYKDGDVEVTDFNYNVTLPPIANCGSAFADYIDPGTGLITVQFPNDGVAISVPMADGATIATYGWDVKDGTITVGTAASSVITATFPAGFRYVSLTVTDSNGIPHTSRVAVLAVDPASDTTIKNFQVSQRLEWSGQTLDVNIYDELSRGSYPDGTLTMFWWDEAASPGDRSHMKFVGWVDNERYNMGRNGKGFAAQTTLHCVDVCGRLKTLPGFPQALSRVDTESPWSYMPSLDMSKNLWYLGFWHSTALNVADFILPVGGTDYNAMRLDSGASSLFQQMDAQAQKMVPDHYLTCNSKGQMVFKKDWRLEDVADRPAASHTITENYWNDVQVEYNRHPKVYALHSGAILSSTAFVVEDAIDVIPLVFSIAPSDAMAFGQGTQEQVENEGLALSQVALNKSEGHRYAMLNSRYGDFTLRDPSGSAFWDYEPAAFNRVQLDIPAAYAAQRGLDFTSALGLIKNISIQYETNKKGTVVKPTAVWAKETSGQPALTHIPEDVEDVGFILEPFVPPAFGGVEEFYGNMNGYVVWDGAGVARTWNLQAAPPVWESIGTGITGDIKDGQYVMVSATTVGMWLLTTTAVWWCGDIMATTPSWTAVLPLATVVAGDVVPSSGSVVFKSMFHYWSQPGHLIVATGPNTNVTTYPHAYFWVTENFGSTWTQVDMDAFIFSSLGEDSGYYRAGFHSLNVFRSAPGTIYALRGSARIGSNGRTAVFLSTDLGITWTKGFEVTEPGDDGEMTLLNPFPAVTDPTYLTRGNSGSAELPQLYISTDEWATGTLRTNPVNYDGMANRRPVNKRTFDNTHVMGWWHLSAGGYELRESFDQGVTWATLMAGAANPTFQTPNGWPPDVLQWVVVRAGTGVGGARVQLTLDNFATLLNKEGNLLSVLPGGVWNGVDTTGNGNGFALPRVGVNA